MKRSTEANLSCYFEAAFNDLYYLESIVKFTKESCLDKEVRAKYYNLSINEQLRLSEERNHYINMLSIAEERISKIKKLYSFLENSY